MKFVTNFCSQRNHSQHRRLKNYAYQACVRDGGHLSFAYQFDKLFFALFYDLRENNKKIKVDVFACLALKTIIIQSHIAIVLTLKKNALSEIFFLSYLNKQIFVCLLKLFYDPS